MKEARISVIMSVYNETDRELESSIRSILAQTHKNLELILVNDNPTDPRIRQLLEKQSDPRIRILCNEKNMGLVPSLNKALHHAEGDFIARMDADDIAEETRLAEEYAYLNEHRLDLVGCWIRLIDEQDKPIGQLLFPTTPEGVNRQIRYGGCLAHPTWLGKRDVFSALGGYRNIPCCEDYDFILRAIASGFRLGNLPGFLLRYRVRGAGISQSNRNRQLAIRRYLAKSRSRVCAVDIEAYLTSDEFSEEVDRLDAYELAKKELRNRKPLAVFKLIGNKNLYIYLQEKYASLLSRKFYT